MRLLVTGGTGFTGSHLVRYLIEKGHEVTSLDNQEGLFYDELKKKGANIIIGSVTDRKVVKKALKGVEGVFHLAAAFRQIDVPKKVYWDVNIGGTRILCEESVKLSLKKFVYCSTVGVHGNVKNPPGGEDAPITPADYYQFTKYGGEEVIHEFIDKGLKAVIIRPAAIYGPGDPERFVFLYRLAKKERFFMFGNGKAFYHPAYIDNLIDGFYKAFISDKKNGEAYIIADEKYYSIRELVKKVGESIGISVRFVNLPFFPLYLLACILEVIYAPFRKTPPLFRRRVDWFRQNRAFDISKAKNELKYDPSVGLEEGLKRTAEWYKENNYI